MRRLTILLAFFALALLAEAQRWPNVDLRRYNDETIVYVALSYSTDEPLDSWIVGAFIDKECRGEAAEPSVGPDGSKVFVLRVHGDRDADMGKAITFRVCHKTLLWTFDCQTSRPVTFTTNSEGEPSAPIILSFTVVEPVPFEAFEWEADAMYDGEAAQLRLTPRPANANTVKADELRLTFDANPSFPGWTTATYELLSEQPLIFLVTPAIPGSLDFHLSLADSPTTLIPLYQKGEVAGSNSGHVDVHFRLGLNEGWQWRSNPYGIIDFSNTPEALGADLIEVRTIDDLLYNDPEWGYFGTLVEKGLSRNKAYKVRMQHDFLGRTWEKDEAPGQQHVEPIVEGWNWIPSPYFYNRRLEHVFSPAQLTEGMAIVAKEAGQAEWDGTRWQGDLEVLPARQSFLLYNPGETITSLTYQPEAAMEQGQEFIQSSSPSLNGGGAGDGLFSPLLPSRFRDNMTMVVCLADLPAPEDFVLGAFVGDECRGSARFIDGRFWLTIHCNGGERVSFRLQHLPTGRISEVTESVTCQQLRLGSLRVPIILHAPEAVTGITSLIAGRGQGSGSSPALNREGPGEGLIFYDLSGRRTDARSRGIVIEHRADGTTRRIIR